MAWEVEYTDEFGEWWDSLDEQDRRQVALSVRLLEANGPLLGFPHSSQIRGSKHSHMRELRSQSRGVHCVFYMPLTRVVKPFY